MALCAFLNYVYVILTYILLVPSSIGYAQTVELSVSPKEDLYLSNNFAFFLCSVEGLDLSTMSVAWTHNGVVFADAVIDGQLQLRSNVDSTFAVDVNEDDFKTSNSLLEITGGGYRATLDVLTNEWQYSGEYQCVVCNKNLNNDKCAQIQISSNEVPLRVAYFPPEPYPLLETSAQQDNSMVLLDEETVVSCYSFPGNPEVEFSLLRGIESIQGNIIKSGDFIFYNYTFTPTIDDNGVIFTCSISNTIPTTPEVTSSVRTNSMSALQVVSIPQVKIEGPTVIGYGFSLTLTCSATSATNTPIVSYTWSVRDLAASRYRVDFDTLTVQSIVEGDGGVVVSCQAIDELGMEGSELYTINAMDPEDITSMVPSTLPPVINEPPVALIVVLSVVGVILLILLIGALGYYCRNKKSSPKSGRSFDSKPAMTSSTNKKDNHYPNSTNGPYTITGNMSNSPKPDIVDGYGNSKYYPTDVDYRQSPTPMYNDHDDYKPPYERTRSQEPFYPGYEKSPEYHYNAGYGYDDENQPYPEDKDEILVGDFTQPSDRQPAYGQGYDDDRDGDRHYPDEYHDSNIPYDYVNRDQDEFNREPAGYDDREPASYSNREPASYDDREPASYDDREPASYNDREPASYDDREPASYDDREPASYDDREPATYDGGYVRGVEEYDGDVPRDNNYNDEYYPPGESYPREDRYNEPNSAHYDDEYPEDRGDMYPKEEGNYPLENEPYGKRDQVPDGQESDFQGEPNNDQYYPPLDLMPDGSPVNDDPYYGYNISAQLDEFDDPQKHHNESVSSERFDPSYV